MDGCSCGSTRISTNLSTTVLADNHMAASMARMWENTTLKNFRILDTTGVGEENIYIYIYTFILRVTRHTSHDPRSLYGLPLSALGVYTTSTRCINKNSEFNALRPLEAAASESYSRNEAILPL
jgi:hypothetical protein